MVCEFFWYGFGKFCDGFAMALVCFDMVLVGCWYVLVCFLVFFWYGFGMVLVLFWYGFDIVLVLFWYGFGMVLVWFW